MIRILGDDDAELATAWVNHNDDPILIVVDRVMSGKGRLLQYYFGQGRRHVVADVGDFRLRGWLRTRWQNGERRWEIRLQPAIQSALDASGMERNASPLP